MLTGTRTVPGTGRRRAAREEEEGEGEDGRRMESGEFGVGGKIGKKIAGDASHLFVFLACIKLREGPRLATLRPAVCPRPCDPNPIFRFQTFVRALSVPYN